MCVFTPLFKLALYVAVAKSEANVISPWLTGLVFCLETQNTFLTLDLSLKSINFVQNFVGCVLELIIPDHV